MKSEQNLLRQVHKRRKPLRGIIAIGGIVLLGLGIYMYGPTIADASRAAQFEPPENISAITVRMNLTSRGQQMFYATSPRVETRSAFNAACQSAERTAAILGCYVSDKIYLFDINDPELDGALEVTAAHELLHAAYVRLNVFDKASVDAMVNEEYLQLKHDPAIAEMMRYYAEAEPGQETNELHSMIGTTIKDLPPNLEKYYARFFNDRQAIVAMNSKYTAVFDDLNRQATELQDKITSEAATIKAEMAGYNADLSQLNADIQSFNERARGGNFSSQYTFNQARGVLISRVEELTNRQSDLNVQIDRYNADVAAYDKLAVRSKQLNENINGVQPPDSI